MQLFLESVFNNPGEKLEFSFSLNGDDLHFAQPALVVGQAENKAGIVTLRGIVDVGMNAACDRCAEPFSYRAEVPFSHTLVTSRESEESDELILVENFRFDAEPLIREEVVFSMPPKMLCRPGCEGLCHRCGQNLNEGPCQCVPGTDPRWDVLSSLTLSSNV